MPSSNSKNNYNLTEEEELYLKGFVVENRYNKLSTVASNRTDSLTILIDKLHHPHNISAILRSAEAFGLTTVHIVEANASKEYFSSSSGISLGSEEWIDVERYQSSADAILNLKKMGFKLVVLNPPSRDSSRSSMAIHELPYSTEKICLVFGSEKQGVSKEIEAQADFFAYIPMYGFMESFNVSVACAICLYSSTLSGAKNIRQTCKVTPERESSLRRSWLFKSIKGADKILNQYRKKFNFQE